jgi:hypothetical protein
MTRDIVSDARKIIHDHLSIRIRHFHQNRADVKRWANERPRNSAIGFHLFYVGVVLALILFTRS